MAERDEGPNPDDSVDEDEVWAKLVAAYDQEPGPGAAPWPEAESLPAAPADSSPQDEDEEDGETDEDDGYHGDADEESDDGEDDDERPAPPPVTSRIVVHPVIKGPRDYELAEDDDEGHFVPPEPPPLPETDVTTKFAWLAVLGGPLLIFAFILLQQELPWWAVTVGIGGFLGGFATLVARMRPGGDEDDDLPGGGAVV